MAALGTPELAVYLEKGVPALLIQADAAREAELREKLRPIMAELPRGQQIGRIYFTDRPMPRTATGKVKRWEIGNKEETK